MSISNTLHPWPAFHTTSIGDEAKQKCQDTIYYLTSRLRAIFLHLSDGTKNDFVMRGWNDHIAKELDVAAVKVGLATAFGVTLHIPDLFRFIFVQARNWGPRTSISITPEMRALILAPTASNQSPYLRHAETYLHQWWKPMPGTLMSVITPEELDQALQYHLTALPQTDPSVVTGTACQKCAKYRALLREASEAINEALKDVADVTQFAEAAAALSKDECQTLSLLHSEATRLGRALTTNEVLALAARLQPAYSSPQQIDSGNLASSSHHNSLLPSGSTIESSVASGSTQPLPSATAMRPTKRYHGF